MKKTIVLLTFVLMPFLAKAHIYWLEAAGSGKVGEAAKVQIYFGEYEHNMREKGKMLAGMKDFKAFALDPNGQRIEIALTQTETCWEGTFTPTLAGSYQLYAVNDTRGVVDWTKYGMGIVKPTEYLRAIYQTGKEVKSSVKPLSYLDMTATLIGETANVQVFKANAPYAKAKVKVTNAQGWEKALTADEQGKVLFKPDIKGLYLIETDFMDKTAGKYLEKDYAAIRNKSAMTLIVR
jgi:uncharacterized GH25 family protein